MILFAVVLLSGGEAPSEICFRVYDEEESDDNANANANTEGGCISIIEEGLPSTRSAGSAVFDGVEGMSMLEGVNSGGGHFDSRFVFCSENNEIANLKLQSSNNPRCGCIQKCRWVQSEITL